MVTYDSLTQAKNELIRKALQGSVFVAPYTAAIPTSLTNTDKSLAALPAGYLDLGRVTTDGAQFARAIASSDISSWGPGEPTRSDFTSDVATLHVVAQETKALTLGLFSGIDTTTIHATAGSGEVVLYKPRLPTTRYYRVLTLAVDVNTETGAEIYVARFFPKAKVTAVADQAFAPGDSPIQYDLTFTASEDDVLLTAQLDYFGGPGWDPIDAGFLASVALPAAPSAVAATSPSAGQASITGTPGSVNGGGAVTSYTATSAGGPTIKSATSATLPVSMSGLATGSYTFTLTEANSSGVSPASAPSTAVAVA